MHLQQPFLELGVDLGVIGVRRDREGTQERPIRAFDPMELLALLLSPWIVSTPSSTKTFTSSLPTSGRSSLIRYSFSVS